MFLLILLLLAMVEIAIVGITLALLVENNFWCFTLHAVNVIAVAVFLVTTIG